MSIALFCLVAFAFWTLLLLGATVGVLRWTQVFAGKAALADFRADEPHGSDFYRRAMRAHANCVENLPVFGAVVLAGEMVRVQSPLFDGLAIAVVAARICQSITHLSSGESRAVAIRFGFFEVQYLAFFGMGLIAIFAAWS